MRDKVAIVGRGIIGRAWAIVFARAGHEVALASTRGAVDDEAQRRIGESLADLEAAGLTESAAAVGRRIRVAASLEEALDGAALAIENLPEDRELKMRCFAAMDELAPPDCVLGSSTSGIPASRFTEALPGRHRCLVTHPGNPPFLLPVVELVPAPWTAPEAVDRCRKLMAGAGMRPITMKKELRGFVFNRLQAAVLNEAISLVDECYVDPEDVDVVMKWGLGLRWSFMGPLETLALNAPEGFADAIRRYGPGLKANGRELMTDGRWGPEVVERIDAALSERFPRAAVGERQAWRDRRLMALARHKAEAAKTIGE